MSCRQYRDGIQELVDGTLGPLRRAELQLHLGQCEACRALLADLQRIRAVAESLEHPAPPDGLWLQIAGRLRQEGRIQATARPPVPAGRRHAVLAIAAGLVLAVGASLLALLPLLRSGSSSVEPARQGTAAGTEAVQSVEDDFRLAEEHLQRGIAKLEEAAGADDSAFDAQTAATLKKNLDVIDQAIAESRAALRSEPQNVVARDSLFSALRRKVALLQDTIALMNEMRKGNAIGAAQIVGEASNKS
jgi:hypothetical protein